MSTIQRALAVFANKNDYERLRESTSQTPIEVSLQARDYLSEFYRMRRSLLPSVEIPFTYSFDETESPKEVMLVGDFTDWEKNGIRMSKEGNQYVVRMRLKPGDYRYK